MKPDDAARWDRALGLPAGFLADAAERLTQVFSEVSARLRLRFQHWWSRTDWRSTDYFALGWVGSCGICPSEWFARSSSSREVDLDTHIVVRERAVASLPIDGLHNIPREDYCISKLHYDLHVLCNIGTYGPYVVDMSTIVIDLAESKSDLPSRLTAALDDVVQFMREHEETIAAGVISLAPEAGETWADEYGTASRSRERE